MVVLAMFGEETQDRSAQGCLRSPAHQKMRRGIQDFPQHWSEFLLSISKILTRI